MLSNYSKMKYPGECNRNTMILRNLIVLCIKIYLSIINKFTDWQFAVKNALE